MARKPANESTTEAREKGAPKRLIHLLLSGGASEKLQPKPTSNLSSLGEGKAGEMFRHYLGARQRGRPLHFGDILDGIHLLHERWVDLRKTERVKPFARTLGVVTDGGEELARRP